MNMHLFLLTTALLLVPTGAIAAPDIDETVETLHREIAALRVVHALDLDAEQIEELVPLVRTGIELRADLEEVHSRSQASTVAVLRQVRDDLGDDGELSEATEAAAQGARKDTEKAMRPVMWELKDVGEEVVAVLDEDQRRQVNEVLSRLPFAAGPHGQRPPPFESGEESADTRKPGQLPPRIEDGVRRHNTRRLFGLVFSEEFLAVLEEQV